MSFAVQQDTAGNILSIYDDTRGFVLWNDAAFQTYNQTLQTPYVLSPQQLLLQKLISLTLAQWQDGTTVTADQKDKIAFFLMKAALRATGTSLPTGIF